MTTVVLEFTIEPFAPAAPGPHVTASIDAARASAGAVDIGPFGTTVTGSRDQIIEATRAVVDAALSNGASRVSLQVSTGPDDDATTAQEPS